MTKVATAADSRVEGTVGELLEWLAPGALSSPDPPQWPPDVFAVAATLLLKSAAYPYVVDPPGNGALWPPGSTQDERDAWASRMRTLGRDQWRGQGAGGSAPPNDIEIWWNQLKDAKDRPLTEIRGERELCEAALQLCAVADEAAVGFGIGTATRGDPLCQKAARLLAHDWPGATLCERVHPSKARVLPKQHAPRSGMTIRSLSHHLALCAAPDVTPSWYTVPAGIEPRSLNILLLPWPREVFPAQFKAADPPLGQLVNMPPPKFGGFFSFAPDANLDVRPMVDSVLRRSQEIVGRIDGVVFPELSLTCSQHEGLRDALMKAGLFLICGVAKPATSTDCPGSNYLAFDIPTHRGRPTTDPYYTEIIQNKHHRWRLDRRQIVQYGIGGQLDPSLDWWEHIAFESRELAFVTLHRWMTLCVLLCEDLARQDPAADLVRSVGPNLVIALLMDGPQLASRWPGRYATVLADDPGCSVLTLTSVGMAELCRPPPGAAPSRVVALWKDARSGEAVQIDLPSGAAGIVLTLTRDMQEEFTADGRTDDGTTAYPTLSGIHPVVLDSGTGGT